MSIVEITKKQLWKIKQKVKQKRISIGNGQGFNCNERIDRQERYSDKPIDQMRKMMERMQNNIKQHPFETFDLHELQQNTGLIKKNRKFANLLDSLRIYNRKLAQKREADIVNYKLYQFYYSTLKICNTKTDSQVEFYLREMDKWFNMYSKKRQLVIHPNKKKNFKKGEDDIIRQTFKSNLPLEIEEYQRKVCLLPAYREMQQKYKARKTSGKLQSVNSQMSDDEAKYVEDLIDQDQNDTQERNKKDEIQLPNLKCYRNQLMRMRLTIQEREQSKVFKNLKKNQTRILIQSSNNFFKPLRNRNDIYHRPQPDMQITKKNIQQENNMSRQNEDFLGDQAKNRIIVSSTAMGFYQIKKRNLDKALRVKRNKNSLSDLPKFFINNNGSFHNNIISEEDTKQNNSFVDVQNISGLSLIRNPFQITKGKKQKKGK